jgi:hypothetical protein
MSEEKALTLLGIVLPVLFGLIGFVFGKRYERQKQALIIRSDMLKPIEEWLAGAERLIGMFYDTLVSINANSQFPKMYSFEERIKANQFISEKTNIMLGILESESLKTRQTQKLVSQLHKTIVKLDGLIKYQLLPLESQVADTPLNSMLSPEFADKVMVLKIELDTLMQSAHSLIAKIKVKLT